MVADFGNNIEYRERTWTSLMDFNGFELGEMDIIPKQVCRYLHEHMWVSQLKDMFERKAMARA
jgi:hypothetical protein